MLEADTACFMEGIRIRVLLLIGWSRSSGCGGIGYVGSVFTWVIMNSHKTVFTFTVA